MEAIFILILIFLLFTGTNLHPSFDCILFGSLIIYISCSTQTLAMWVCRWFKEEGNIDRNFLEQKVVAGR